MPVPAAAVMSTTLPASNPCPSISLGATVKLMTISSSRKRSSALHFPWYAERARCDDVALDLVGAAVEGVRPGEQVGALPFVELVVGERQPGLALDVHGELTERAVPVGPQQLRHVVFPHGV